MLALKTVTNFLPLLHASLEPMLILDYGTYHQLSTVLRVKFGNRAGTFTFKGLYYEPSHAKEKKYATHLAALRVYF